MPPRVAPPEPQLDHSSPFYVHPGDGPSSVAVTPLLTDSNYHSWSRSMKRALGAKMKLDFIDGTLPVPVDAFDPSFRAWNRCDLIRISELQQEIYSLRQDNRSVSEFYSELKQLWEELELYLPIPQCTCRNRCTCEAMRSARNNHTLMHTIRFLTGLNDQFAVVKSQILLIDPLPQMNKVFSQHERQSNIASLDDSKFLVNATRTGKQASGAKRVCSFCGKDNHVVENCFKKNGTPPNMMKKFSASSNDVEGGHDDSPVITTPSISQDQYARLMSLLQSSNLASNDQSASSNQVGSSMMTDLPSAISKLCHTPNYLLTFNDSKCVIQYQRTMKMIGFANEHGGLYYLNLTNKIASVSAIDDSSYPSIPTQALWHFRLGHPSHSRYTWVILMKSKAETRQRVVNLLKMIDTQFSHKVKIVRTDNGLEFMMHDFYSSKGIIHQTSCVESPQQNGRVKRKHQHLLNIARTLLYQSNLPKTYWSYAVLHATYIINRMCTPVLENKSPHEMLHNQLPDLHDLKVFGSLAYASSLSVHRTKLSPRGRKCVFLGYKQGVKGTVLLDLNTKEIFISRNVTHYDHFFPYQTTNSKIHWHYHSNFECEHPSDITSNPPSTDTFCDDTTKTPFIDVTNDIISNVPPSQPSDRPHREKHKPSYLEDFVCNSSTSLEPSSSSGIPYPISSFHSLAHLSPSHTAYIVSLTQHTEPKTYLEACKSDHWIQAMNTKLEALSRTGTWKIVDLPSNVRPIGCRWVYKIKHNSDGSVERYKARLVAKGYTQIEGIDFFDTFSPVAKLTTVRLLLALASIKGWFLHQLDVNNAFLHGDLQEDVYMVVPEGVPCVKPNQACKLLKSLYGLKQASRKWYEKLTSLLVREGYTQSTADYSLFTLNREGQFTALLIYVDDIILSGTSMTEIERIKTILDCNIKIKDLGIVKYFLGLEVAHSKTGISISQRKYCIDLLKDFGLLASKPASTPLDPSVKLHNDDGKPFEDIGLYRRLTGKLLYLTNTRPDITYATQQLSQFLHKPTMTHYKAACRVIRYLKHNPGRGLLFQRNADIQILGYSDADWAASNPLFHERTKHIEIDCHLVREKVQEGMLRLLPIATQDQLTDCFTKALSASKFHQFMIKLGLLDIYQASACGRVLTN
ncbi:hypothetical protein TSUD_290950 [Trifolium subterraneum]|uniref:Integrase catalytic domain-containing protein n=1 Tax=Trifolium subterraneum TaxID=3900 RepID=A0A2Z6P0J6_TRISU|nr:hypothetical protein TSUD_290950 [Trifolium subterraneum]